jgi:hypothetical protein
MSEVIEFVLILTGALLVTIVTVAVVWVRWRARVEARRIKQHFASKRTQPGRPTQ